MATSVEGKILEVRLEDGESVYLSGKISCPARLCPAPGQYLLASRLPAGQENPAEELDILPAVLFAADYFQGGFKTGASLPHTWNPGDRLALRGPLGRGFRLKENARHVALAALGGSAHRLMPLLRSALARQADVLLFAEQVPLGLPLAVEVAPLEQLRESLAWADALAIDLPRTLLAGLPERLGLEPGQQPPCPVELLVSTPMPCAGQAECGVCAVAARREAVSGPGRWLLACKDGPVFEWKDLLV
jgi:hypothetical protein